MERKEKLIILGATLAAAIAGVLHYTHSNAVLGFIITAAA
jgi:hypothetical protein